MRIMLIAAAFCGSALVSACYAQPQADQGWRAGPSLGPMMGYGYCPGATDESGASAQGWYGPMMVGMGGMMGGGMMGRGGFDPQQTSAWLDAAKSEIGVTAAQQQAWSAYAEAVEADRAAMLAMHAQMPAMMGAANANAPDRLQAHLSFMQARLASLQQVEAASQALYQVLTPDQRARANRTLWWGCW